MPAVPSLSCEVRPAEADDQPDMAELGRFARTAAEAMRGGLIRSAEVQERPPSRWAVATIDGMVVGMIGVDHRPDGTADVGIVFVRDEARQLGLGEQLLAWAIDDARSGGCRRLDAVALPGDRETKNLYERAGIVARSIVVSRGL